jgi:hypothetical protein
MNVPRVTLNASCFFHENQSEAHTEPSVPDGVGTLNPPSNPKSFTFSFSVFRLIPRQSAALDLMPLNLASTIAQCVVDSIDHELVDFSVREKNRPARATEK